MRKVQSLADLQALRDEFKAKLENRDKCLGVDAPVVVKVAMATCGIAAGAKEVMEHMQAKSAELGIKAEFVPTGCMGYCYAEPTIEVLVPGRESVVFGNVDIVRADEILNKYILDNTYVDGIIPVNYEMV